MQRSGLIATKIGNSSYFQNDGTNTHVTILKVDECIVSKIKTTEKDGYNAVQIAAIETGTDISWIKDIEMPYYGPNYTSSQLYFPVFIPNALRATGTIGGVGGTGYFQFFRNGAADPFDEVTLWGTRDNLVYLRSVAGTISGTAGHGGMVSIANSSAMLEIGAEL